MQVHVKHSKLLTVEEKVYKILNDLGQHTENMETILC